MVDAYIWPTWKAPVLAQDAPFRIEPSANYLELRRLTVLINEAHRLRYWAPNVGEAEASRLDAEVATYWKQIQPLLAEMTSQAPRTPSALLDYAAVMLRLNGLGIASALILPRVI